MHGTYLLNLLWEFHLNCQPYLDQKEGGHIQPLPSYFQLIISPLVVITRTVADAGGGWHVVCQMLCIWQIAVQILRINLEMID